SGKVGIGTTAPATKLQVSGTLSSMGFFDADAVGAVEVQVLPAGGCVYSFTVSLIVTRGSAGGNSYTNAISVVVPGAASTTTTLTSDGASTLAVKVYSTGQVTVLRNAGASTFKVSMIYLAL